MAERVRILVVDDEPEVCNYLTRCLAGSGYQVSAVTDGADAYEAVKRAPGDFDLVITDLCMEGMDGQELTVALRTLCPGLPVLLISAYVGESDPAMLRVPFLAKPFLPEALLAKVSELTS